MENSFTHKLAEIAQIIQGFWPVFLFFIAGVWSFIKLRGYLFGKLAQQDNKLDIHKEKITHIEDVLFSGSNGSPPFITEPEHDRLQLQCQEKINSKIDSINSDIKDMKATMKEGDECRKDARAETSAQFSALRKEFAQFYTNMQSLMREVVTQNAINDVEIKNIKDKIKD